MKHDLYFLACPISSVCAEKTLPRPVSYIPVFISVFIDSWWRGETTILGIRTHPRF